MSVTIENHGFGTQPIVTWKMGWMGTWCTRMTRPNAARGKFTCNAGRRHDWILLSSANKSPEDSSNNKPRWRAWDYINTQTWIHELLSLKTLIGRQEALLLQHGSSPCLCRLVWVYRHCCPRRYVFSFPTFVRFAVDESFLCLCLLACPRQELEWRAVKLAMRFHSFSSVSAHCSVS